MAIPIDNPTPVLNVFPSWVQQEMRQALDGLEEARFYVDTYPKYWVNGKVEKGQRPIKQDEMDGVISRMQSLYKAEFRADDRLGLPGTMHRITAYRNRYGNLLGLIIRFARLITDVALPTMPFIVPKGSVLIVGPPGVGKSTYERAVAIELAKNQKVTVVDTSGELCGDGDTIHPLLDDIWMRIVPVMRPEQTFAQQIAWAYRNAVANAGSQVVVGDEVKDPEDISVVNDAALNGVKMIVTVHGETLRDVVDTPKLAAFVGYPDRESKVRRGRPSFQTAIVIRGRGQFVIYPDLALAVDSLLRGREPVGEAVECNTPRVSRSYTTYRHMVDLANRDEMPSLLIERYGLSHYVLRASALYHHGDPTALEALERAYQVWLQWSLQQGQP